MKKLNLMLVMFVLSIDVAYAAGSIFGKILRVRVDDDGRVMAIFDANINGTPPGCVHPSYANALAFDAAGAGGKSVLALVLTAKVTGATITAYGLGTCGVYGGSNVETWNYGMIN